MRPGRMTAMLTAMALACLTTPGYRCAVVSLHGLDLMRFLPHLQSLARQAGLSVDGDARLLTFQNGSIIEVLKG